MIEDAFRRHSAVVGASAKTLMGEIHKGAQILLAVAKEGRRLFICGNGGSAADSQHFAAEWLCKYKDDRRPLPATALTTDTSALTAIGNDFSFEEIFARQLTALGQKGDALVAITTSGRSKNVLRAIAVAKEKGMSIIVLTGQGGAGFTSMADVVVSVPSAETARIQEIHLLTYHAWCEYVDASLLASS